MNLKKFKFVNVDVLIGEKTTLTGNITTESAIKIDGIMQGNITTTSEVIISETASVEGDVIGSALIVSGKLKGNVTVTNQLVIKENGVLEGDIKTGALVIEEGGIFIGSNHSVKKEPSSEENIVAETPDTGM
ncbi:MAG: polymer-forming cytoskeletal protein [Ruminococcaceae bacterium]|nr:polymer-forming cytoskeletal protein [Oscillospiraceae bacterium]